MTVVLITGGSRGIGASMIPFLKDKTVVVASRSRDFTVTDFVVYYRCDVSVRDDVVALFKFIRDTYGRLDVLVNNAAYMHATSLQAIDAADAAVTLNTNFMGPLWCMQESRALMQRGLIINVLATCLEGGRLNQGLYAASKAALKALSDCYALELSAEGRPVSIISVYPRRTMTQMRSDNFPSNGAMTSDCLDPDDVARAVVQTIEAYIKFPEHVTGSTIRIT